MAEESSYILFPRKRTEWLTALGFALMLMVALTIMMTLEAIMHPYLRIGAMVVAFVGVVLFGYLLVYQIMRAMRSSPLLTADESGIHFDVSLVYNGHVSWEDISTYALAKRVTSMAVLIHLHDPRGYLARQKGMGKRFAFATHKRWGTPVAIPVSLLSEDAEQVLRDLSDFGKRVERRG